MVIDEDSEADVLGKTNRFQIDKYKSWVDMADAFS
jgi:hypothetical protein